jgi:cation transport ATPase
MSVMGIVTMSTRCRGLLLRGGGEVLEKLAGVRAVVLDKTGTLTLGEVTSRHLSLLVCVSEATDGPTSASKRRSGVQGTPQSQTWHQ